MTKGNISIQPKLTCCLSFSSFGSFVSSMPGISLKLLPFRLRGIQHLSILLVQESQDITDMSLPILSGKARSARQSALERKNKREKKNIKKAP